MKKNIIYSLVLLSVLFFGCNDDEFLDRKPIDFLAPDNFNTEKDIREAVNGIYKAYISDREEPIKTDFMVDNGYYVGYQDMWHRIYTNETSQVVTKWQRNYRTILRANTVLFYIDDVELNDDLYKQYKGEAIFLRALAYFDLLEFFGGVPLRKEPESIAQADKPITEKEGILDFVLTELEAASDLLPTEYNSSNRGRATKGAALAIKARALLYNHRYAEAAEYCQKVKDLGIYEIYDNYGDLFIPVSEGVNKENIFEMQYETNQYDKGLSNQWYTRFVKWGGYQILKNLEEQYYSINGLSINDLNNTMYSTNINPDVFAPSEFAKQGGYDHRYSNRDPRLYATLVVPYSIYSYNKNTHAPEIYYPNAKKSANFSGFKARKYVDYTDHHVNSISGVNPVIIRYADVLLMEAEALVETGDYDDAYVRDLINQVRQRPSVMMPKVEDVEGTNLPQVQMRQIIRHERRVEFALEGLRIFDIKRWDIGAQAYTDGIGLRPELLLTSSAVYQSYVLKSRSFDANKGYLWPIPRSEVDSNNAID